MTRRGLTAASIALVAAMLIASIGVGIGLPAEARLPVHWSAAGEVDGDAPKWVALLFTPVLTAALSLLFYVLPAIEPRSRGLERSQGLYLWGWAALLFMQAVIELVILATALGRSVPVPDVVVGALGVMLVLIGNQLGKSRSMYLIGLRTPWTLASEEVWIKTHRLGGKLMVGGGLFIVALAAMPLAPAVLVTGTLVVVAAAALLPIAYSFLLWRREQHSQSSG